MFDLSREETTTSDYLEQIRKLGINPAKVHRNLEVTNTIKMAKKSDKEDYMQHLRLVLLGIAGVGTIGFIIQFVFSVITIGE